MSPSRVYTATVEPERLVPRSTSNGRPGRGGTPTASGAPPATDFISA